MRVVLGKAANPNSSRGHWRVWVGGTSMLLSADYQYRTYWWLRSLSTYCQSCKSVVSSISACKKKTLNQQESECNQFQYYSKIGPQGNSALSLTTLLIELHTMWHRVQVWKLTTVSCVQLGSVQIGILTVRCTITNSNAKVEHEHAFMIPHFESSSQMIAN